MFTKRDRIAGQLADIEVRLGQLDSILDGIQRRLEALHELPGIVKRSQDLAVEARERADNALDALADVAELPGRMDLLQTAVAHGIEHVERTEARIRATVQRARRELADSGLEHPGLSAEAGQLQLIDGGQGAGEQLPPVREDVARPQESHTEALTAKLRTMGLSS